MRRLLIATTNADKLREIRGILGHLPIDLLSLRDFARVPEPEETGATFEENARQKALYYDATVTQPAPAGVGAGLPPSREASADRRVGSPRDPTGEGGQAGPLYTVAEDSGLVVDALGGEPGIQSARFLRPDATYPERFAEIYRRLAARPGASRSARFVCAVAVVYGGAVVYETTAVVEGEIAPAPAGEHGFGYDPIFYYPPYRRTLAEVTEEEKSRVAHRGKAFAELARWLSKLEGM